MKHIKKKFVQATKVGDDVINLLNNTPVDYKKIKQIKGDNYENYTALALADNKELIQTFKYNAKPNTYFIAEANPILIYFETARHNYRTLDESKKKLLENVSNLDATLNNTYTFYGASSISIILLFTSLEAFINSLIPHDYVYKKVTERGVIHQNRLQIQSFLPFDEKIKIVIPEIHKKAFHKKQGHKYESIKKLKEFRDKIVHTKSDKDFKQRYYRDLYTTALNFEYLTVFQHTRDFINFYEGNLIEDCPCGRDF